MDGYNILWFLKFAVTMIIVQVLVYNWLVEFTMEWTYGSGMASIVGGVECGDEVYMWS